MTIYRDMSLLHPKFFGAARKLEQALTVAYQSGLTKTNFKVFETFRDPIRQADLLVKKATKAGPFASAHQLGLACDFVPYLTAEEATKLSERIGERVWPGWNWHSSNDYSLLKTEAMKVGLEVPIPWDLCHVQHPNWERIKSALNAI